MTLSKRLFDIALALLLVAVLSPLIVLLSLALLILSGRPLLYRAERMRSPQEGFVLWKFRTMTLDDADAGVTGGDKSVRITKPGRFLRRSRLDELPQLWNVLRGDISFVGPRPPLRRYVEQFPALYAEVLRSRPGITGLATLRYHAHEERLLSACRTPAQTEAAYRRRCVPRKAALDLIYARNRSLCFDIRLIAQTALRGLPGGRRGVRRDAARKARRGLSR
ncbi:sugar transferase [Profundibacterium mesophilum]|uniref:Sugar transferase n=1 Tax=Profundibacterium mesophilum KAUST100406-0324 TaxID=1037889 RepID=A0A921NUM2_9RHOB|nr:sugar transferase [Profundibacterium mesophilum]KAF0676969.1 Sugar transferase [Profundibacterium mesophilum KAUST100406-0324]